MPDSPNKRMREARKRKKRQQKEERRRLRREGALGSSGPPTWEELTGQAPQQS